MKTTSSLKNCSASMGKTVLGFKGGTNERPDKNWHYLFVISILTMFLSVLVLLNAYFHFVTISPYNVNHSNLATTLLLSGYFAMFINIALSPVPDYFLVPLYGFLSSIGIFNPYTTFLVCLAGALLPIEFACGRLAARPLLLKVMSYSRISETDLEEAEKWIAAHGRFSIFISTFIPFFYSVVSLAAGTLKMSAEEFFGASTVGFALRFIFLEAVGYFSIYIFTASFDYSQRTLFFILLILSSAYIILYFVRMLVRRGIKEGHTPSAE